MSKNLVVIPAHNEEETIHEVVTGALKYADVSVTDDGSRDKTPEILKSIQKECGAGKHKNTLHVITHPEATHIPRGIQDGLKYGVSKDYEFIVTMDAGMSHDPEALPEFFGFDRNIDVVIGSRTNTENIPLYRKAISKMATILINYTLTGSYFRFYRPWIRDCTSGFRRYSRRAAESIATAELRSRAFDFHMESLAICIRAGMSAAELPITYIFTTSSFNRKVLKLAMKFGLHLLFTKKSGRKKSQ